MIEDTTPGQKKKRQGKKKKVSAGKPSSIWAMAYMDAYVPPSEEEMAAYDAYVAMEERVCPAANRAEVFLSNMARLGVRIWLADGRLQVRIKNEAYKEILKPEIRRRAVEIVDFLQKRGNNSLTEC